MSTRTARRATAFTLIELLVVIAILCLLMAILLPSFGRAKEAAQRMTCTAHLSGIGMGFAGYMSANNGSFPPAGSGTVEVEPGQNDQNNVLIHSWSTCSGQSWRQWYWADFIISYFDSEAKPTQSYDCYDWHASVMNQPASGNYYSCMYPGGLVMSKRMNCPAQIMAGDDKDGYPDGCDYPPVVDYHRHDRHYVLISGNNDFWSWGQTWTIPNDGKVHCQTPPEPLPVRPPQLKAANYPMDRLVLIGEPSFSYETLNYYSFAQDLYNYLPHPYDGDKAGNFMFMDGHIETFTRTYIKNWADSNNYDPPSVNYGGWIGNGQHYPFKP
jgi:prepilin-type N-terminal cleavage/methylation domain-containing protein